MKIYLVGGAVRDFLMNGSSGNDRDYVVVGATEKEMLDLGYKKVGADFPVFLDSKGDQFALARKERKIAVGYHGFETQFDSSVSLEDDLYRRDLTINAIAQDIETGKIIDPFNGIKDLQRGILRHVSNVFVEDPLRVIRIARFYARWSAFDIALSTVALCQDISNSSELNELAEERHWAEMDKMFKQSTSPRRFFCALNVFNALRANFYNDLLGTIFIDTLVKAADAVKRLNDNDKAVSFTALAACNAKQKSVAIPLRAKKLTQNIELMRSMQYVHAPEYSHYNTNFIYNLIYSNRGFDNSSAIKDVLQTVCVGESVGMTFFIENQQLWTALKAGQEIKAEKFLHLTGPEIGKAIAEARKIKIKNALGL